MQAPPGAPGTARQGPTRIIMLVNHGGTATQPRAPGHERPHAALRAARHGRLSAASTAPGADIPRATTARAPGQYCLSAAPRAPGHSRPLASTASVSGHDRLSAALPAPGDDLPLAAPATPPSHHYLSAAPIATVSSPAGLHRLRQEGLLHNPANPRTLTNPHPHRICRHSRANGNPRPPVATAAPQAGQIQFTPRPAADHHADSPSLPGKGLGGRSTFHQAHPAIQVPPQPRPCSTAATGCSCRHHPRAPPLPTRRKPILANHLSPLHMVERGRG